MASPAKLAHIVLRTGRLREMVDWYVEVLEARVVYGDDMLCFVTYDDEHHRVAFVATGASQQPTQLHSGLHHVAFTYATLADLIDTYLRLKTEGVQPCWTINHGPTTSMYFADPDGNHVELQYDNFATDEELQAFFDSGAFAANPIGVEFDPEELVRRFQAGEPVEQLVKRS
jgi:catechol-2,3-dioxygenase